MPTSESQNEKRLSKLLQLGGIAAFLGSSLLLIPPLRGAIQEVAFRRAKEQRKLSAFEEQLLRASISRRVSQLMRIGWAWGITSGLCKLSERFAQ